MKLNPDCIRDILLYLEDNLSMNQNNQLQTIRILDLYNETKLSVYTKDEINYSVLKLVEAEFILGDIIFKNNQFYTATSSIADITWIGHDFLNSVRPKTVWDATKNGASKLGLMSVSTLKMISQEVIKAIVTNPDVVMKIVGNL